jgi:hypothetical protein
VQGSLIGGYSSYKELNAAQFGKPASFIRLNGNDSSQGDVNIRSKEASRPQDIPEGAQCRNLYNFNHLIAQVTTKD